jgi:hypothetical protein
MANTTVNTYYDLRGATVVDLALEIGFGQPSKTFFEINGHKIGNSNDSFVRKTFDISAGDILRIRCIIQDQSPNTDDSIVEFQISGGVKIFKSLLKNKIVPTNGIIAYTYRIKFI